MVIRFSSTDFTLASERGGNEQDQQRIAQASLVRRHSLPAINEGAFVIVAGDLNDGRGEPALRRIRGLDDIWPDLIETGEARYFSEDDVDTRWTYVPGRAKPDRPRPALEVVQGHPEERRDKAARSRSGKQTRVRP